MIKRKNKLSIALLLIALFLMLSAVCVQAAGKNGWNAAHTLFYQDGKLFSGKIKIDGKSYLFKKGKLQTGFQTITYKKKKIKVYYDPATGAKVFGSKLIDGDWYCFIKGSGEMLTGWREIDGKKRYYFGPDGIRVTGFQVIGKTMCIFDDRGVLQKSISQKKSKKYAGTSARGMKTYSLLGLSEEKIIEKMGPLFTADQKKTGVLASVSLAQFILESWYGRSELALMSNNCFGMKDNLSGNTWKGSAWDGVSVYVKSTQEEDDNGRHYTYRAAFRKYECIEDSIADHSAYLLGAKNEYGKKRYAGLKGCRNYKKAIAIIKAGGYATDSEYVSSIINIIERWNLTRFDLK